jgi:hypothetical protein
MYVWYRNCQRWNKQRNNILYVRTGTVAVNLNPNDKTGLDCQQTALQLA